MYLVLPKRSSCCRGDVVATVQPPVTFFAGHCYEYRYLKKEGMVGNSRAIGACRWRCATVPSTRINSFISLLSSKQKKSVGAGRSLKECLTFLEPQSRSGGQTTLVLSSLSPKTGLRYYYGGA